MENVRPRKADFDIFPFDSCETEPVYLIEKPNGEVLKVSESVKLILDLVDGERTLEDIRKQLELELEMVIEGEELEAIVTEYLVGVGLIHVGDTCDEDSISTQDEIRSKSSQVKASGFRYSFFIPLIGERTCNLLGRLFSIFFSKFVFIPLFLSVILLNALTLALNQDISNLSNSSILLPIVFVGGSLVLHEIGHIAAAVRNGVIPKEAGVGMFLLFPIFYVDLNCVWKLDKKYRSQVDLGGIYFQLMFSSIFIVMNEIWWHTNISIILAYATIGMVLLNLVPFFKWDGYWLVSDVIGINNLNARVMEFFSSKIGSARGIQTNTQWDRGLGPKERKAITAYSLFFVVYVVIVMTWSFLLYTQLLEGGYLSESLMRITILLQTLN
ncbi:MAG: hypothetical protein RTV72_06550, partial [Candidatus Thorarchaeota archaeon]